MRVTAVILAAVTGLSLAACSSAPAPHPSASHPVPTTAPAAVATPSQNCSSQVHTWAHDQGLAQMHQIGRDSRVISKDAFRTAVALRRGGNLTGRLATWQADTTALETDAQAAASNPPPACGDAADYGTAMQDYTTGAKDELAAINDIGSGNYTSAGALLNAGSAALNRGSAALGRANAAFSSLG
jgi:hypothetical protein